MWKDHVKRRFFWAKIERDLESLLYELVKAEEEEDSGIYLLMMHFRHIGEESPFGEKERAKIRRLLSFLIKESRRHQKILKDLVGQLEKKVTT